MDAEITLQQAKLRYWQLQRQSDLALSVLKDRIRVEVANGQVPADIVAELHMSEQVIKEALKDAPRGTDAFTYSLPDGSYVRRWFSLDVNAFTWYCARALEVGFGRELGPYETMDDAIAALDEQGVTG